MNTQPNRKLLTIILSSTTVSGGGPTLLQPLLGQPLFLRTVERVRQAERVGPLLVLTTIDPADDPIAHRCWQERVPFARSYSEDLIGRLYRTAGKYGAEALVVVEASAPLLDPRVLDRVIAAYQEQEEPIHYVSNLHPRSLPTGNEVEIIRADALERMWHENWQQSRQQLAPFLLAHPDRFRSHNVAWPAPVAASSQCWTAADRAGYRLVRAVYEALYPHKPRFGLEEIAALLKQKPGLARLAHRSVPQTLPDNWPAWAGRFLQQLEPAADALAL